jgi:hypothetical protein
MDKTQETIKCAIATLNTLIEEPPTMSRATLESAYRIYTKPGHYRAVYTKERTGFWIFNLITGSSHFFGPFTVVEDE